MELLFDKWIRTSALKEKQMPKWYNLGKIEQGLIFDDDERLSFTSESVH